MDAPNPVLIMVINMVIVFAVLYVLGILIKLIHFIDPTKNKSKKKLKSSSKVITKKPKPVKPVVDDMAEKTLIAVITTSLMAYGCRDFEIKSIKNL